MFSPENKASVGGTGFHSFPHKRILNAPEASVLGKLRNEVQSQFCDHRRHRSCRFPGKILQGATPGAATGISLIMCVEIFISH